MVNILLLRHSKRLLRWLDFILRKIFRVGTDDLDLLDGLIVSQDRCTGLPLLLLLLLLGRQGPFCVKRLWLMGLDEFKYSRQPWNGDLDELFEERVLGSLVILGVEPVSSLPQIHLNLPLLFFELRVNSDCGAVLLEEQLLDQVVIVVRALLS